MSPNWHVEFHVHTYASLFAMGAMLFQNVTRKSDQLAMYVSRLLNRIENNYSTIQKEDLNMVFLLYTSSNITCWAISLYFM
jgi:hypothetical protein